MLTQYNPDCFATCPECGFVRCKNTGGNLIAGADRHMDFVHKKCGTEWRYYIDREETRIIERA